MSGQHFVEHQAQAEEICPSIGWASGRLLGRHILRSAADDAARVRFLSGMFCDTEVEYFHQAIGTLDDIFRLDIAMDDPGFMSCLKRASNLNRDLDCDPWLE